MPWWNARRSGAFNARRSGAFHPMTPYYDQDGVTLFCGDMREIVPELSVSCFALNTKEERPFAAVVTDPPYHETNLAWDVWPEGWPSLLAPLTNCLWCFGSMRMFLEQRAEFDGWKLAQDVVWEKHNGSGLHADRFRRVHENAVQFYRGEWGALYKKPPMVTVREERRRERLIRGKKPEHWGGVELGRGYDYAGRRLMRSVIAVTSCHGQAVNETQKPEGIIRPLLEYSAPPGGPVLDPFAGSGTVLAVARALGMRAVGIEIREAQCAAIVRRLAQGELFNRDAR